mmetsp:Transcript_14424/g.27129  ORF Transcript_14424/g.27129 Transcript_14424/m.27129 type:complete len:155 (-) Transcript_14424:160-624(-)
MKLVTLLISLFVCQTTALVVLSKNPQIQNVVNRRHTFIGLASTTVATILSFPNPTNAAQGAQAFVGTFSDPINHPGGTRTIRLLDQKVGDYQLAEVIVVGGVGEPKNVVLPAAVIGDRTIVIDFSPKGGPRDFVGVLDGKDIKFLKDGNKWPRL